MCYGHASSGRGLLGMLFLRTGAMLEEKSLFISPGRPQDWFIQASSVEFDLQAAHEVGTVRSLWTPSFIRTQQSSDLGGERVLEDLLQVICRENPERVLLNDFVPFLQFHSFKRFREAFASLISGLENVRATVFLMMPEVANEPSQHIIDFMKNCMTGTVHIALSESDSGHDKRSITLLPGIGHVEHSVFEDWEIPRPSAAPRRRKPRQKKPVAVKATSLEEVTGEDLQNDETLISMPVESLEEVTNQHEGFVKKLDGLFKRRTLKGNESFLLVALRVEAEQQAFDTGVILDQLIPVVKTIVADPKDLLLDPDRQRIIALLPNTSADGVQSFFEMIQDRLSQDHPDMAEQLPHVVSAVVVPNGQPFENPQDFLAYALEGR